MAMLAPRRHPMCEPTKSVEPAGVIAAARERLSGQTITAAARGGPGEASYPEPAGL